jgi:arsenate reductase
MRVRVWAYAKCSTRRNALRFLAEKKIAHEVIAIREQPPTVADLRKMHRFLGGNMRALFNTSGLDYKALGMKDRLPTMSDEEAYALLATNGNLVRRPFVLGKNFGVVGFKPAEWERLIS